MDRNELRALFDRAVANGDEDEAVIYGGDLLHLGEGIHVVAGFRKLQEQNPKKHANAALMYVTTVYRLSKAARDSVDSTDGFYDTIWNMNLHETENAARVADMYDDPVFNEYWDYLTNEQIGWILIAAERSTGEEKKRHQLDAVDLMDRSKIRHNGDWIQEYLEYFDKHGMDAAIDEAHRQRQNNGLGKNSESSTSGNGKHEGTGRGKYILICLVLILVTAVVLYFTGIFENSSRLKPPASPVSAAATPTPDSKLRPGIATPKVTPESTPKVTAEPSPRDPPVVTESQNGNQHSTHEKDPDSAIGSITILVHALRLRQSPSTDGKELGKTTKGEEFQVFEIVHTDEYTWYRIGTDFWVADKDGNYVSFSDDASPTSWDLNHSLGTIKILVDTLKIRVAPSTRAEETIWTAKGDVYQVYDVTSAEGYTWYRAGPEAWIADKEGKYVLFTEH